VNNALFATYLENARIAFLGRDSYESMILARLEIDFRSPIEFGEEVAVGLRTSRIGSKSFELEYRLCAGERVVADARTVLVGYDYAARRSVELSDAWRRKLADLT
jgi:acyl-CoA thioester hydrolase